MSKMPWVIFDYQCIDLSIGWYVRECGEFRDYVIKSAKKCGKAHVNLPDKFV